MRVRSLTLALSLLLSPAAFAQETAPSPADAAPAQDTPAEQPAPQDEAEDATPASDDDGDADDVGGAAVQAARITAPMPRPANPSSPRRLITVRMSKAAPWSTTSSSGRSSGRPW